MVVVVVVGDGGAEAVGGDGGWFPLNAGGNALCSLWAGCFIVLVGASVCFCMTVCLL